MRKDEIERVLTDPLARELLGSANPARLAYNAVDGSPRAIPIGFHWDGRGIQVFTAPIAPKVKALRANPKVALTIDTNAFPPHVLLLRGTASIEIVDGVPDEYLEASHKFVGRDQWPAFDANVRATYKQMARIAIDLTWAKVMDFQTRVPEFVHDLAAQR
jgi:hypothetical protein